MTPLVHEIRALVGHGGPDAAEGCGGGGRISEGALMRRMEGEVDRLVRSLTPGDRQAIAFLDLQRLQVENAGVKVQATEPSYGVLNSLRRWETLIRRMEDGWARQDYYMVYEYLNDLTVRDGVEGFLDAVEPALHARMGHSVARLDSRYRAVTVEDGGEELALYWRPLAEGRETRWWWTRRPVELPPGW